MNTAIRHTGRLNDGRSPYKTVAAITHRAMISERFNCWSPPPHTHISGLK
jgi:hypothetical protein